MTADATVKAASLLGESLTQVYKRRTVLDVPRIQIAAGETFALLGPSGAGKSTLLRILGLLEQPTTGRVLLDGTAASGRDLTTRRTIAAVFQKPYLLRGTVAQNAGYGLKLRRVPAPERARRVAAALERVGLAGWEARAAATLSGGEAQRVALARALVLEPSILLLDEPLSYLDPLLRRSLSIEFASILASSEVTALYVTHDQDEAAVVADRIGVMRDGAIVAEGDPDAILGMPRDAWHAAFVDMEPPLEGTVLSSDATGSKIAVDRWNLRAAQELAAGAKVQIAVRPEDVAIAHRTFADTTENSIEAEIVEVRPRGGSVQLVVAAGSIRLAAMLSRTAADARSFTVGDSVVVSFEPQAVRTRLE